MTGVACYFPSAIKVKWMRNQKLKGGLFQAVCLLHVYSKHHLKVIQ